MCCLFDTSKAWMATILTDLPRYFSVISVARYKRELILDTGALIDNRATVISTSQVNLRWIKIID